MSASQPIAYLDCFSGISGDMLLGALLDCGLSEEALRNELGKLELDPYELTVSTQLRKSISARSVQINSLSEQRFRNLRTITDLLSASTLDPEISDVSLRVFRRLAEAEAKIHGKSVEEIHFHEVGALDTIIDVVGVVAGFRLLGITDITCSPLPIGRGFVKCAHGTLPLPAPAVCELLTGVPIIGDDADMELVTPTGAALAVELANKFGPLPPMTITGTGYGAGDAPGTGNRPNLLRLITGEKESVTESQEVEVIETHLDDWNPEGYPLLCSRLLGAGALDVSLTPIQMKKGRPGFRLTVLGKKTDSHPLKELILAETSAIGLRFRTERRVTLPREIITVETPWGDVEAKKVRTSAGEKVYPEYESCRQVAEQFGVPLDRVYRAVLGRFGTD